MLNSLTQSSRKIVAKDVAVAAVVRITLVNAENWSVLTMIYWLLVIVFSRRPTMSFAINRTGSIAGINRSFRCLILCLVYARMTRSLWRVRSSCFPFAARCVWCALCRTYAFSLHSLPVPNSGISEGQQIGERLVRISYLFHSVVACVQGVHLCPSWNWFVVGGLSSRLVGVPDQGAGRQVIIGVSAGISYFYSLV